MRTTVTLDSDVEARLRRVMSERGLSFKQALNDAIRRGTGGDVRSGPVTTVRSMGVPRIDLDRALQLAGELEDEELVRKMRSGR